MHKVVCCPFIPVLVSFGKVKENKLFRAYTRVEKRNSEKQPLYYRPIQCVSKKTLPFEI